MIADRLPLDAVPSSDLICRARSGDHDAVVELLKPYEEKVFRLACRMAAHVEDAEDLAQDALARIVARLPSFRGECAFGTWVYRVAVNVCLTERAKRKVKSAKNRDALIKGKCDPATNGTSKVHKGAPSKSIRARFMKTFGAWEDASVDPDDLIAEIKSRR